MKPVYDHYTEQIAALNPEKPCRLYRNLHTGLWSVKQDRVAFHTRLIYLKNVKFLVNERLRQKVIATRSKNVHAFVQGYMCPPINFYEVGCGGMGQAVWYNPYKVSHFISNNQPCDTAEVCILERMWDGTMNVCAKGINFHNLTENHLDTATGCGMMVESVAQHML